MKLKLKFDYNYWSDLVCDLINSSKSKLAKEKGHGAIIGFQILGNFLEEIANRAIKTNDPVILECLLCMCVIQCSEEEKEDILKRAKEVNGCEKDTSKIS